MATAAVVTGESRVAEMARMLSGDQAEHAARRHAAELLAEAGATGPRISGSADRQPGLLAAIARRRAAAVPHVVGPLVAAVAPGIEHGQQLGHSQPSEEDQRPADGVEEVVVGGDDDGEQREDG